MKRSAATLWIVLLVLGLTLVARPAARWARRTHDGFMAGMVWDQALADPAGGGPGAPCAWLSLPGIGLETLVLAGVAPGRLHRAPCLDRVEGNTVILAHRDAHFAPLRRVRHGDALTLQDRRGETRNYTVDRTLILAAEEAESFILSSSVDACLILVTCHPFHHLGPAPDRFLVIATECAPQKR